jgi:flagellin-like hook-associated protein FlgL
MTRVPTFSTQQLTLFHTLNTQSRMADLQLQLASGKKSQAYSGVSKDSLKIITLETRRLEIAQFTKNINTADNRLKLMDATVESIEELALELRDILDRSLQLPDAAGGNLPAIAANLRDAIVGLLNTRIGDTFLFGGTRTDRLPVDITGAGYNNMSLIQSDGVTVDRTFYEAYYTQVLGNTLPYAQGSFYNQIYFEKNGVAPTVPAPADPDNPTLAEFVAEDPGLWQYYVDRMNSAQMLANPKADYYQGDTNANSIRADATLTINYDVRADQLVFQQLIAAADAIANLPNGDANDANERAVMAKAREMVRNSLGTNGNPGFNTINQVRMSVTTIRETIGNTLERHQRFDAYAEGVIADLENIDEADVIVRLQGDQSALEASFAMLARLQSLSLLNFL